MERPKAELMLYKTPFLLPWLYPKLVWQQEDGVYLTFDDGPIPEVTKFVLDTLQKYNVKATFFCIGDNIAKHPAIFQKVLDAGHRIGNHTEHHVNGWKTPSDIYLREVDLCQNRISTKIESRLFRPPYGRISRNQIDIMSQQYEIIMWSVLSQDYNAKISAEDCLAGTCKALRPGSIVLFHDSLKARKNMEYALPRFIEFALKGSFEFKTL